MHASVRVLCSLGKTLDRQQDTRQGAEWHGERRLMGLMGVRRGSQCRQMVAPREGYQVVNGEWRWQMETKMIDERRNWEVTRKRMGLEIRMDWGPGRWTKRR